MIDHPEIADIGCIGIPHQDLGEELIALIVPQLRLERYRGNS